MKERLLCGLGERLIGERGCTGLDQRRGHSSSSIYRHVKEEKVVGSNHHRFSKSKSHLTNLTAFCAERYWICGGQ